MLLSNIRGLRSKEGSLKKIMRKVRPSMMLINETLLRGRMKPQLEPFVCWNKNRQGKGGGGVVTAVAQEFRDSTMGLGEGEEDDEVLVTRVGKFHPALTVINCYGEQKSTKVEVVEEKWRRLVKEMEAAKARGEFCLVGGDLNKWVGADELGIAGNHPEVSAGGRMLRCLLAGGEWILVNAMGQEVVEGGPVTRVDPATGEGTALDMFIVSKELRPYVEKMVIDERREMTPARIVKKKGKFTKVYTDHHMVLLTLAGLPMAREVKDEKVMRWNLAKEGGWLKYSELCEERSEQIEKLILDEEKSIEEVFEKFEKIHEKIKHRAFGKVTITRNKKEKDVNKADDVDETGNETERKINEELEQIKEVKGGRVGHIWDIRKRVLGKDKTESMTIINPETGKVAVTTKEIKEVTLKYCKETLLKTIPEENYIEEIEKKKREVSERMQMNDGDFKAAVDVFKRNIKKFKNSGKKSYDFLTKTGEKFQMATFKLCERMFKEESFPEKFKDTTCHMIFKGRGRKEVLKYNRFIHCKYWLPRVAEGLVVEGGLKEALNTRSSMYQVGGQPGHRPEELLFALKSVVARYASLGQQVIIQSYDVS